MESRSDSPTPLSWHFSFMKEGNWTSPYLYVSTHNQYSCYICDELHLHCPHPPHPADVIHVISVNSQTFATLPHLCVPRPSPCLATCHGLWAVIWYFTGKASAASIPGLPRLFFSLHLAWYMEAEGKHKSGYHPSSTSMYYAKQNSLEWG